jgi:hypothetical protein
MVPEAGFDSGKRNKQFRILVGIFPADQDSCGVNFNVALQDTDFVNMM